MDKNKLITVILALILFLTVVYALTTRSNGIKNIKQLTEQINQKVDTLTIIKGKYDELSRKYSLISSRLDSTSARLKALKNDVDSISHARINSLSSINWALKEVIDKSNLPIVIDSTKTDFRFQ